MKGATLLLAALVSVAQTATPDVRANGNSVADSGMLIGSSPIVAEVIVDLSGETVEGSLLDNDRKPVTLTRVVLVPEPARRQNHSLYKTALTDLSGRFVIRGVAPGAYKVFGWNPSPPMNAHMNQEFLSRYEDRGQAVQVTQGFSGRVNVWVIDR